MNLLSAIEPLFKNLLSSNTKKKIERTILVIAIASFIIHLSIIYLVDFGFITLSSSSDLLKNPIAAIYTPFSFILVYEVYLLLYYLPKSISTYISKQYEIITLIIIRRLFKDLSTLSLSDDWFKIKYDLQFTYDLLASVLLFFLIYLFYFQSKKRYRTESTDESQRKGMIKFIKIKQTIAALLVPVLFMVAIYSFLSWLNGTVGGEKDANVSFKNINNIFFDRFFTIFNYCRRDFITLLFLSYR